VDRADVSASDPVGEEEEVGVKAKVEGKVPEKRGDGEELPSTGPLRGVAEERESSSEFSAWVVRLFRREGEDDGTGVVTGVGTGL